MKVVESNLSVVYRMASAEFRLDSEIKHPLSKNQANYIVVILEPFWQMASFIARVTLRFACVVIEKKKQVELMISCR